MSNQLIKYSSASQCAPDVKYEDNASEGGTCYSIKSLKIIANSYNNYHDDKIKLNQTKNKLWKDIKSKITECDNELCWLKNIHKLSNQDIENITFNPLAELKLSTTTINNKMKQYERIFKDFLFLSIQINTVSEKFTSKLQFALPIVIFQFL